MIGFLTKIFIRNPEDVSSPQVRQAYGVLSGAVGVFLNILLFAGKFAAGLLSGSIAITADAFNNLSDAGSSVITLIGFKLAGQKPDPHHPFGHGRMEYLSGLMVSIAILIMAFELVKSSVSKVLHPEEIAFSPVIIVILAMSVLVKGYMYFYNKRLGGKLDSAAMMATAKDSLSDALATTAVMLCTLASHFWGLHIDGWCGVLVGLFILYTGVGAARDTINPLLGQAPDPEFVKSVEALVMSYSGIIGVHDLIVHNYGPGRVMISLHAEVPADGDILVLHDTIDNIEHDLKNSLQCEAVIHMDPVCNHDEETVRLRKVISGYAKDIGDGLSVHDLRLVKGNTHTNVIFDLLIPYSFPLADDKVLERMRERIQELDGKYRTVINVDKS